ncbi:plasmid pRiA4b ORF-3 family protein [Rhizobium ruizarguesonis]|uniref:plasmid pRiA4b ORF-3 family protein n=1 Tax=Rhizobium ruizarguesonis TaxID=2081791 RepID=UPI0010311619|nr:plasmid pRiA4b ORF-3 family protein [Rhizobium ruizarguesonis]TAV38807.1 plasmid pRiA4b ORF-3 family protein [Rhizobium ruizarguesonis]
MFQKPNAVQVRISLDEIKPKIWRRLVLPSDWTLEQLHLAIQAAFNWWNYHLYEFHIGGLRFGDIDTLTDDGFDDNSRVFDFREVRMGDFQVGSSFRYLYDFGDSWRHTVSIEAFATEDTKPKVGRCLDGARARPPEDVGGTSGYERFLEIIADTSDPENQETLQWCGGFFDPEWFDLAVVNKDLRTALRTNVKRRLHQPKPKSGIEAY